MRPILRLAVLLGATVPAIAALPLDTHRIARDRFGNDAPWYEGRIPFFESADSKLDAVYYYRWALYRAHQRDLGDTGYISTEFLDDVGWQLEPYASLNDATGFHLAEGRWLRDRRYADDYINFMYRGGNDRHFTDHMADSVYGRFLVDGDRAAATRHLDAMRRLYALWDDHYDATKGLYWVEPLLDATEYTISSIDASGGKDGFRGGDAFRPSINAYMFANARAIARLSALTGDTAAAATFDAKAAAIKRRVQDGLWSEALGHFIDRYKVDNAFVKYWQPIRGRELVGYLPWSFNLADDDAKFAGAWTHLLDKNTLGGPAGFRTVESRYEHYMQQYRYEGAHPECQWNGPIWPFQTTQVLMGMANLLDHYHQSTVTRGDYMRLLRQYAALHYQGDRLDIEEDYHPDTGRPIVGLARSHHYFHSGFTDLILTGLVGIRPRADDALEVNPLLPAAADPQALAWFRVQDVPYHGHSIAVTWDVDGRHYGGRAGLTIEVDGRRVAHRPKLERIVVPITRRAVPQIDRPLDRPIDRPIDRAVQLVRGQFPKGSASSNNDAEAVHDAIDGRIWFFPELPNGWSSAASRAARADEEWYQVDFGKRVDVSRAELAFFDDGKDFGVPRTIRFEAWDGQRWNAVKAAGGDPVANGITQAAWPRIAAQKVRVLFAQPSSKRTRLVEFKLFQ